MSDRVALLSVPAFWALAVGMLILQDSDLAYDAGLATGLDFTGYVTRERLLMLIHATPFAALCAAVMRGRRAQVALFVAVTLATLALFDGHLVMSNYSRRWGHLSACRARLMGLSRALQEYRNEAGSFPSELEALVPGNLEALPTCPVSRDTYAAGYESADDVFTVSCKGAHHRRAGAGTDRPRFGSVTGLRER